MSSKQIRLKGNQVDPSNPHSTSRPAPVAPSNDVGNVRIDSANTIKATDESSSNSVSLEDIGQDYVIRWKEDGETDVRFIARLDKPECLAAYNRLTKKQQRAWDENIIFFYFYEGDTFTVDCGDFEITDQDPDEE